MLSSHWGLLVGIRIKDIGSLLLQTTGYFITVLFVPRVDAFFLLLLFLSVCILVLFIAVRSLAIHIPGQLREQLSCRSEKQFLFLAPAPFFFFFTNFSNALIVLLSAILHLLGRYHSVSLYAIWFPTRASTPWRLRPHGPDQGVRLGSSDRGIRLIPIWASAASPWCFLSGDTSFYDWWFLYHLPVP